MMTDKIKTWLNKTLKPRIPYYVTIPITIGSIGYLADLSSQITGINIVSVLSGVICIDMYKSIKSKKTKTLESVLEQNQNLLLPTITDNTLKKLTNELNETKLSSLLKDFYVGSKNLASVLFQTTEGLSQVNRARALGCASLIYKALKLSGNLPELSIDTIRSVGHEGKINPDYLINQTELIQKENPKAQIIIAAYLNEATDDNARSFIMLTSMLTYSAYRRQAEANEMKKMFNK